MIQLQQNKDKILISIKLLIVGGIFLWLFKKTDMAQIAGTFGRISYLYLGVAFSIALFNRLIISLKWLIILKNYGTFARFSDILKIVFISQFIGSIIPSLVDVVRFVKIQEHKKDFSASLGSVIGDRILAVFAMCVLCIIAIFFSWDLIDSKKFLLIIMLFAGGMALLIPLAMTKLPILMVKKISGLFGVNSPSIKNNSIFLIKLSQVNRTILEIHSHLNSLLQRKQNFFLLILLNLSVQFCRVLQFHFLFRSLGYPISFAFELSVIPIIILLTLLPISFSGLGIKEGAFVYFFHQINVPLNISLCVSFLSYLLILVGVIPGALLFLIDEKNKLLIKSADRQQPEREPGLK